MIQLHFNIKQMKLLGFCSYLCEATYVKYANMEGFFRVGHIYTIYLSIYLSIYVSIYLSIYIYIYIYIYSYIILYSIYIYIYIYMRVYNTLKESHDHSQQVLILQMTWIDPPV